MHNCVRDSNGNTIEMEWKAGGLIVRAYSASQLNADEVPPPIVRLSAKQATWFAEELLRTVVGEHTIVVGEQPEEASKRRAAQNRADEMVQLLRQISRRFDEMAAEVLACLDSQHEAQTVEDVR